MMFFKTYTLDKALVELRKYNQSLDNIDDILQLAIEERIKISFEIPHSQVLVRMDEEHFKMEECYISRLGESYLIPSDGEKIGIEFLLVGRYEHDDIYPFIKSNDLKKMVARNDNWVLVYPLHMKSSLDNRLIEVAPCTIYPIPKRNDINYKLFCEWALFAGLEILDGSSEQKVTDISVLGKYESSGYLFRLENKSKHHGYRIDKNQLRITKNEIENFIKNEYLNLSLPHYSLKKAKQIINEYAPIKTTKTELIELAQNGIIRLSIHNPEWRYVQTDRADQELEVTLCKVLREYSIHILTPKKGLVSGTGTEDSSLLCGNGHSFATTEGGTIYPFIDPKRLRNMELSDNKTLKIYTHEMDAIFQDQSIKVSKVNYAVFPEKGDPLYPEFTKWLKNNLKLHSICLDEDGLLDPQMHFDTNLFYKLEKHKGRGVEVKEKDLVITKEELGKYTLSIMNEGHVAYEKNKGPQLDAAKEAPQQKQSTGINEKRLEKLKIWISDQGNSFEPFNHNNTKQQVWDSCRFTPVGKTTRNKFFREYAKEIIGFKSGRPSKNA